MRWIKKMDETFLMVLTFSAFFSEGIVLSDVLHCSYFRRQMAPHAIFAKLRSKIAKSPKIGGKVCAHHFI